MVLGDGVFDLARLARFVGFDAGFGEVVAATVVFSFFFAGAFLFALVGWSSVSTAAAVLLGAFLVEVAFLAGAFLVEAVVVLVAMGNVRKSFHRSR